MAAMCKNGMLPEPIGGHRVGLRGGLLWAEGHPSDDGLARPADLPAALDRLERELLEAGVPLPVGRRGEDLYGEQFEGFAGIRRLDSTVDLQIPGSSAAGLALMAAVAAVARDMPRSKCNVWWDSTGRNVQTVALHGYNGGRLLGRVYDKGAESGTAPPGRLIRPEDQRRWAKGHRRGVEELTGHYVRRQFAQRFAPLWQASKGVTVAGPIVLAEKLKGLVDAGELAPSQAETLAGHLLLPNLPGLSASTRQRRRRQLREHGLVLADGVLQEVEIDVADVLEHALETELWGLDG